jgi:hypothetical protein
MGRSKVSIAISLIIMLTVEPAFADSDALLQAVTFALTGSDNAKVKSIDRANCIIALGDELFRLNNVQVDRIFIKDEQFLEEVTVELHGSMPIHEADDIFEAAGFHIPGGSLRIVSNEYTFHISTRERDRVRRAWGYIYSHGCVGQKSPF